MQRIEVPKLNFIVVGGIEMAHDGIKASPKRRQRDRKNIIAGILDCQVSVNPLIESNNSQPVESFPRELLAVPNQSGYTIGEIASVRWL
jgi:hypothetical protein